MSKYVDKCDLPSYKADVWQDFISYIQNNPTLIQQRIDYILNQYGQDQYIYTTFDVLNHSLDFWEKEIGGRDMWGTGGVGCADGAGAILGGLTGPGTAILGGIFASVYCTGAYFAARHHW
jgi:hypothetical protein